MVIRKVVIDKDTLGWAKEHEKELLQQYDKILKVSEESDLPQRSFDSEVAAYCKKNECDLLTMDKTAYIYYFDVGIKTIQISREDWYQKGDRPVYRIKIM